MQLHDEVRIYCKIRADKPRVVGSGWVNGSGHGGIGIVHQVLVGLQESYSYIRSENGSLG